MSIRLSDCRAELAEDEGLLWNRDVLLLTVVFVVQSNADQLVRIVDRCLQVKGAWEEDVLVRC